MKTLHRQRNIFVGSVAIAVVLFAFPARAATTVSVSDGQQFVGENTGDLAGTSVSTAGDINADGFDDFLVGARSNDAGGSASGAAYLFYGGTDLDNLNLDEADVKFVGEVAGDVAGFSVAAAGDVDNDGVPDILIGAIGEDTGGNPGAGAVYLIYGISISTSPFDLSNAGAKFIGESAGDSAGQSVAGVGDVNGDGVDDILIGAYSANSNGGDSGAAYLIYGAAGVGAPSGTIDLSTADAILTGSGASAFAGFSVDGAGDVNGDTFSDLLIGSHSESSVATAAGATYLVYGGSGGDLLSGTINLGTTADATFTGTSANDNAGYSVAGLGDTNGDSYGDIIIGAPGVTSSTGAAYIVYGGAGATAVSGTIALANADAIFSGAAAGDLTGRSVARAGDVNDDNYNDMLIGAEEYDSATADDVGATYVILGSHTSTNVTGAIGAADALLLITGATADDKSGNVVASAGDVNGDDYSDLLIGASNDSAGGSSVGAVYVGYVFVDIDKDGTFSDDGFFTPVADCNDGDASTGVEVMYYTDTDGDGLGDPDSGTAICSATAPVGYSDDNSDTDDTVANNGVEIPGDGVDNDGDGEIDEDNTVDDNGQHPGYKDNDPEDTTIYTNSVSSLAGGTNGTIVVTFKDDSVYRYPVFDKISTRLTQVLSYNGTGYAVVVHPDGKQLGLVNVYTGTVHATKVLSKKKAYTQNGLKVLDVRKDGSKEVVITSKAGKSGRISVVKVLVSTKKFGIKKSKKFKNAAVRVKKTAAKKKTVLLKNKKGKKVLVYRVSKKYVLKKI